jgi:hypothetical protein
MRLHTQVQNKHNVTIITKVLKNINVKISINISSVILKHLLCMNKTRPQTLEIV